jgi:hypothetical protein
MEQTKIVGGWVEAENPQAKAQNAAKKCSYCGM